MTTDPARAAAAHLLTQVEGGSRLEPLLEGLAGRLSESRDRRFVRQLTAGVLKFRDRLDWILDAFSKRPVGSLTPSVRQVLRLGAYQLLWLDRVPARAAVHTSVELARRHGHDGVAGYVNAVLRRVASEGAGVDFPSRADDPVGHLAVFHSHPRWLVARWVARWGIERTEALLLADNEPPPVFVRAEPHPNQTEDAVPEGLVDAGAVRVVGRPDVFELRRPDGFFDSPAFAEGRCFVQDLNAGLAAQLLMPRPGDRVLDACAAPGGKAMQLAGGCRVVAGDLSLTRLQRLLANARRLKRSGVAPLVADAAVPAVRAGSFDRVLVDVPCSGTGILGRHPDARWRKAEADLPAHAERQLAILEGTFAALRPQGVLVYSTCSLEEEENDAVVDRFLSRHVDARLEPAATRFPGQPWADRAIQTVPGRDPGDGAYAARIRRLGPRGGCPP